MKLLTGKSIPILLLILVLSCVSGYADVRIMSYNIKDFWLRFDGEPGSITNEGGVLDKDDLERLEIVAGVINKEEPDIIGIFGRKSIILIYFDKYVNF